MQCRRFLSFIYPIYNHNWRNISTISIYNKTSIKRNILTIKKIHREVGRAKDLSVLLYIYIYITLNYTRLSHMKYRDTHAIYEIIMEYKQMYILEWLKQHY